MTQVFKYPVSLALSSARLGPSPKLIILLSGEPQHPVWCRRTLHDCTNFVQCVNVDGCLGNCLARCSQLLVGLPHLLEDFLAQIVNYSVSAWYVSQLVLLTGGVRRWRHVDPLLQALSVQFSKAILFPHQYGHLLRMDRSQFTILTSSAVFSCCENSEGRQWIRTRTIQLLVLSVDFASIQNDTAAAQEVVSDVRTEHSHDSLSKLANVIFVLAGSSRKLPALKNAFGWLWILHLDLQQWMLWRTMGFQSMALYLDLSSS